MKTLGGVAALACAVLLAACSSDSGGSSQAPSPTISLSPYTLPSDAIASLPASEIPTDTDTSKTVVTFVDEHRVTIELMVSTAAGVRKQAKRGDYEAGCPDLDSAVTDVDDALTTAGLDGDSDPLVSSLLDAVSAYQNATNACAYPRQSDLIVSNIGDGNAAIKAAERRAKALGTRL